MEKAKIIPIPKVNNPTESKDFRAINIFEPCSKIYERHLYDNLINHLNDHNHISANHHDLVPVCSTIKAIISMQPKIQQNRDKKEGTCLVALDQSAYLDIIDHSILIQKLKHIGVNLRYNKYVEQ